MESNKEPDATGLFVYVRATLSFHSYLAWKLLWHADYQFALGDKMGNSAFSICAVHF